jgi:uncharacterized membrane protein YadS
LFLGALVISYVAGWSLMSKLDIGAPLFALLVGLLIGNLVVVPEWLKTSLRTEYYVKTGIVLLGATLPVTLIIDAGPAAFVQATIVSVTTWLTIYFAATRLFGLDPRFGAVLGTGGAVCGVSGSIAIGGAVRAHKDHIAIGVAVVSLWALVMIFVLAFITKQIIIQPGPPGQTPQAWYQITPGEAGAWVGTAEYADAAGFAVVAELAKTHGDAPILAFTLMKVIGRDIWIGIWAFILSLVAVMVWDKREASADGPTGRVGAKVIWERFPKFVLGFFAASCITSLVALNPPADHVGRAPTTGVFKSKTGKKPYHADFSTYAVPPSMVGRFAFEPSQQTIAIKGEISATDYEVLSANADAEQRVALQQLQHASNWKKSELDERVMGPFKKLRAWMFVLCFLCIGLSTRVRELLTFGLKPFWAFSLGVLVNVPLGYLLTTQVFKRFWQVLS